MKLEQTMLRDVDLVIDEFDIPVAVQINGAIAYRLYDDVIVTADVRGYIGVGISQEGYGKIVQIKRDDTDHFYGILMDNGEFGYLKAARIQVSNVEGLLL